MHAHGDCHACHSKEAAGHAFCYFSQRSSAAPPLLEADERLAKRIHISAPNNRARGSAAQLVEDQLSVVVSPLFCVSAGTKE